MNTRVESLIAAGVWENKRRPAGNRAPNPADLSNGASRMIIAAHDVSLSEAR